MLTLWCSLTYRRFNLHLCVFVCYFILLPSQNVLVWTLSSTTEYFLVLQTPSLGPQAYRLLHRSPFSGAPPGNYAVNFNYYNSKIQIHRHTKVEHQSVQAFCFTQIKAHKLEDTTRQNENVFNLFT